MQYILTEQEKKDYDEFLALKETPIAYTTTVNYGYAKFFTVHWWGEKEATAFLQFENKQLRNELDELRRTHAELVHKIDCAEKQAQIDARNNRSWFQKLF